MANTPTGGATAAPTASTAEVKPSGIVIIAPALQPQAGVVNCHVTDADVRAGTCSFDVRPATAEKIAGKTFELKEVPPKP